MDSKIEQMLHAYEVETLPERKNAIKEIMQEIVLCGLSRAGFFKEAAFYGGTALRIFYGLDRFSEDLDFSLMKPDPDFQLSSYFPILRQEIHSYGLQVEIQEKEKTKESQIRSAFLKGNTREHLLLFYPHTDDPIAGNEVIKVKFEVDTNPPDFAEFETKYRLLPTPYAVRLYNQPSLFAGKLHAVLCRSWQNRVKGRDLYDYIFYRTRGTPVNLKHLHARLIDSGYIGAKDSCTIEDVKHWLSDRFAAIDYDQAKKDVLPFIHDTESLSLWSADFFQQITEGLCESQ